MTPALNLLLFVLAAGVLAALFWPRHGVVVRERRSRKLARRAVLEDALKHVFNHDASGHAPTLESLAGALEISTSRAVALIGRLQDIGLARFVDGRLVLTEEGRRYAVEVIRAHRLWERYLADETGVDPVEWHQRAEREEHRLTPEQADALSERLGHPRFDPHGDPIPTAAGDVFDDELAPLTSLQAGERAEVAHVEDEPQVVYAQLVALGVYPGLEIGVVSRNDQRFELEADGRTFEIAPLVAQNISVRRNGDETQPEHMVMLASLHPGESAEVVRLSAACRGIERRRLMDLGVVPGTQITFERRGLTGGLTAYKIRDTVIGLREEQARLIGVRRNDASNGSNLTNALPERAVKENLR